jgi:hypothetical protein
MSEQFTITIPDNRARYMRSLAQLTGKPVEDILAEALIHPIPPVAPLDKQIEQVQQYSDVQLWAIIEEPFAAELDARMQTLNEISKRGQLTLEQQTELNSLAEQYAQYELLRAKTLVELKNRQFDIQAYLTRNVPR